MKKLLFLITLSLIIFSFNDVSAKVCNVSIKRGEQVEKTRLIRELNIAKINDGMDINFDLVFNELNMSIRNASSGLSLYIILLSVDVLIVFLVGFYLLKNKKLNIESIKKMKKVYVISMIIFLCSMAVTVFVYGYSLRMSGVDGDSKEKISKPKISGTRLARSCYSDSYLLEQTGYCIDWNKELANENGKPIVDIGSYKASIFDYALPVSSLITVNSKEMQKKYTYNKISYKLLATKDVSDTQNEEVILGIYESTNHRILLIIGQDGGVVAPVDMSFMFATYASLEGGLEEDEDIIPESKSNNKRELEINVMDTMSSMDLSNINVSDTTNMSGLFVLNGYESEAWNVYGLDKWNTSNVENMSLMFLGNGSMENCSIKGLESFDTSNVTDMSYMFYYAFDNWKNINISSWNTANVTNMSGMFYSSFNNLTSLDLSKWDTSRVTDMSNMFKYAFQGLTSFDISRWDTSNVTDMSGMFYASLFNLTSLDISKWNTSNVTNMSYMFGGAFQSLTSLDISKWNTSKVTDMSYMFSHEFSDKFKLYINNFDFAKVKNYEHIFNNFSIGNSTKIYVGSEEQKRWLLNLSDEDMSPEITEKHIIVAGKND